MNEIQVIVTLKIHHGKLDEFKALAAEAVEKVKANEPGNSQYDWYFNNAQTECVVIERYADSAAIFAHLGNVGELLGKILQVSDISLKIFGNPSDELRGALKDMKSEVFSFYKGI